jgi:hypothetical protein
LLTISRPLGGGRNGFGGKVGAVPTLSGCRPYPAVSSDTAICSVRSNPSHGGRATSPEARKTDCGRGNPRVERKNLKENTIHASAALAALL